jgi:hypothetical protein
MHGLNALRETLQQDKDLTTQNTSIVSAIDFRKPVDQAVDGSSPIISAQSTVGPASISAILSASLLAQDPPKASISTTEKTVASAFSSIKSIIPVSSSSTSEAYLSERFTIVEGEDLKSFLDRLEPRESGAGPVTAGVAGEGEPATAAGADAPASSDDPAGGAGGSMETD